MKIKVNAYKFIENLRKAYMIIQKKQKNNFPIIENVKITAQKNNLVFTATNLVSYLQVVIPLESENIIEEGEIITNTKALIDLLKQEKGDIILSTEGKNSLFVKTQKNQYELYLYSISQFPEFENQNNEKAKINFKSNQIVKILQRTSFLVKEITLKPAFSGVYMKTDSKTGQLRVASTDNFRLAIIEVDIPEIKSKNINIDKIIPIRTIRFLEKLLYLEDYKQVEFSFGDNFLEIQIDSNILLKSKYIDDYFPLLDEILEKKFDFSMKLTHEFFEILEKAKVFVDESKKISLNVRKNFMTILVENQSLGRFKQGIKIDSNNDLTVNFNCDYLEDIKKYVGANKVFFNKDNKPFLFQNGNPKEKYFIQPLES